MKTLHCFSILALLAGVTMAGDTGAGKEAEATGPAAVAEPSAAKPSATIRFANDDRLSGSLESLTPDLLVWKSPVLETPTPFFRKKVLEVSLPPPALPEIDADHEALVTLTNGDTVRGQLASVTDEAVSLETWFAGRMRFNRLMVRSVKIDPLVPLLYRGPVGTDGWVQPGAKPAWTYGRSAFRSLAAGSIGRDGLLPEECSVSFDVAWRSDSFNLKLILFSKDPSVQNSNSGYELSFQRGSIYLRNNKTSAFLGNAQAREFLENDRLRVEIRASLKSGKICLFINERIAEVWTDQDLDPEDFGQALQFVSLNTLPVRISDIQVARWDGVVDQTPEPRAGMMRGFGLPGMSSEPAEPEPAKTAEGRMKLANGDSLTGEVNSIQDGVIDLNTPLGEIKLPVSRLRSIALKTVDEERCIRRNGDVRASFPDGSSLVFKLDKLEADSIRGSSQNFGDATFKLSAFDRIEFNIYEPDFEDIRGGDPW
jgi:hypothetical protein